MVLRLAWSIGNQASSFLPSGSTIMYGEERSRLLKESCWLPTRGRSRPSAASHRRIVLSSPLLTSVLPSGVYARPVTRPLCPSSDSSSTPVFASQTLIPLSDDADAI